jgi:hypothetical protein
MKECWSEGELRAWLDGELTAEDRERIAAHVADCTVCSRTAGELSDRAQRVAAWMGALPDVEEAGWVAHAPKRRSAIWRWAGAAAALAAGALIGTWTLPRREPAPPAAPILAEAAVAGVPARAVEEAALAPVEPSPVRTDGVRAMRSPARRNTRRDDGFVRLDNEWFETGVVVRVALGPNEIPADVIFGPDGRAHAIRLVNYK